MIAGTLEKISTTTPAMTLIIASPWLILRVISGKTSETIAHRRRAEFPKSQE